ncbi:MAG: leucine-rich repeat domain-containing protein [Oscillospiraceae bacterium]
MKYCWHCMNPIQEGAKICPFCKKIPEFIVPEHHLPAGTILNHKYLIGEAIGEGGFGITYIGRDTVLDMRIAVKEYYPCNTANRSSHASLLVHSISSAEGQKFFENGKRKFLEEARMLAQFSGETGIVDVRDFFEENNTAYIVMAYLEGETLKQYIERNGKISVEETLSMLMPVMQSLRKVHSSGLIHRDISPDNIMLKDGQAWLLDFGAARNVTGTGNKSLSVILKQGYAPEEQYRSKGVQGSPTDIYALCATIYKCITGITPDDAAQRIYHDELVPPSQLNVTISSVQEYALMKGLGITKEERWQTIDEFLDALSGRTVPETSDSEKTQYYPSSGTVPDSLPNFTDRTHYASHGAEPEHPEEIPEYKPQQKEIPEYKPQQKEIPEYKPQQKELSEHTLPSAPPPEQYTPVTSYAKKSDKKKIVKIAAIAAAVLLIIGISAYSIAHKPLRVSYGDNGMVINIEPEDKTATFKKIEITSEIMEYLKNMPNLHRIDFYECTIGADVSQQFKGLSNIDNICLSNCSYDDTLLSCLPLELYALAIKDDETFSDEKLNKIPFAEMEKLGILSFSEDSALTDLSAIAPLAQTLTTLTISGCPVKDFSVLDDFSALDAINANNCGLEDLSSLKCTNIRNLDLNDNAISDIEFTRNMEKLYQIKIRNNRISDISPLENKEIWYFYAENNQIQDISALASSSESLQEIYLQNNQITTLSPLASCKKLSILDVNGNQLENLDGLESAIKLESISCSDNQISDISGLTNATILKNVSMNQNQISDISILAKSAATLKVLSLNQNKITDISALSDTVKLCYLSIDDNAVTSLAPLSASKELMAVSAENNQITSLSGLENTYQLSCIYLPNNQISDMSALSQINSESGTSIKILNLSRNKIQELVLPVDKAYGVLAVYQNPIQNYDAIGQVSGSRLQFTCPENPTNAEGESIASGFSWVTAVDCSLDKQVAAENAMKRVGKTYMVDFASSEETDAENKKTKNDIFGISETEEENQEETETEEETQEATEET